MAVNLSDGSVVTVTPSHVFWVESGRLPRISGWLHAQDLWPGDRLRTACGYEAQVIQLRYIAGGRW